MLIVGHKLNQLYRLVNLQLFENFEPVYIHRTLTDAHFLGNDS
jgi:hypothetical protein